MKMLIYNIFSWIIKNTFHDKIKGKDLKGVPSKLYYEVDQHLNFFFSSKIDYEQSIRNNVRPYIKKEDLVFDVGANIGQYCLFFSDWVGQSGKVISYEPDDKNFTFLEFNVGINKCKNVITKKMALGEQDEELDFYPDDNTGGRLGSLVQPTEAVSQKNSSYKVKVSSLSEQIKNIGVPAFIKIDVEGYEVDLLKAIKGPMPKSIFFIEVREETKHFVFDRMQEDNFKCLCVDYKNPTVINNSNEIPSFANLLFLPQ